MSKDPGYSDSKADRQGSRLRKLEAENKKLRETLGMVDAIGMPEPYAKIVKEALKCPDCAQNYECGPCYQLRTGGET